MKVLNPLQVSSFFLCVYLAAYDAQMRRAVRDYKYEVNEGRMPDECVQYLTQLQKDWEQHRVKECVAALRKEERRCGVGLFMGRRSIVPLS